MMYGNIAYKNMQMPKPYEMDVKTKKTVDMKQFPIMDQDWTVDLRRALYTLLDSKTKNIKAHRAPGLDGMYTAGGYERGGKTIPAMVSGSF